MLVVHHDGSLLCLTHKESLYIVFIYNYLNIHATCAHKWIYVMICIPLVLSSACLIIPAVTALWRSKKKDGIAISVLALSRILFHSRYSSVVYLFDTAYAHAFGTYYTWLAIQEAFWKHRPLPLLCTIGCIGCWQAEGRVQQYRLPIHIGLHAYTWGALMSHFYFTCAEDGVMRICSHARQRAASKDGKKTLSSVDVVSATS